MRPGGLYFTLLFDRPPYDGIFSVNSESPKKTQPTGDEPIVYIVDDDVSVRESLRLLFRSVSLCAELFESASELLQRKLPSVPSCLVLDVRLPGLSGFELHSELTKANIHIPIIFMTAHGDIPMSVRAMKSGAVDFITKPFRDQDLLEAVAAAINRDREMVPHHQGAIDMAVAVLRHGRNPQIRRLAQEIIVTQQQEIAAMRLAVGQSLPPSLPAPTQPLSGASARHERQQSRL